LGLNDDLAAKLFRAGGITLDLVVEMPAEYIAESLEISEEEGAAILAKAQELISTK
jgi:N utilization substance protein A